MKSKMRILTADEASQDKGNDRLPAPLDIEVDQSISEPRAGATGLNCRDDTVLPTDIATGSATEEQTDDPKEHLNGHLARNGDLPLESGSPLMLKLASDLRERLIAQAKATRETVFLALKIGLLLKLAKCLVPHGQFETWCRDNGFTFSRMTRSKYLRLSDYLCVQAKCKSSLLLTVELGADGRPCSYSFDEARVRALVAEICGDRSLIELYDAWQIAIAKPQEVPTSAVRPNHDSDAAYQRFLRTLDRLCEVCSKIPAPMRQELLKKLNSLVAALNTANELHQGNEGGKPE